MHIEDRIKALEEATKIIFTAQAELGQRTTPLEAQVRKLFAQQDELRKEWALKFYTEPRVKPGMEGSGTEYIRAKVRGIQITCAACHRDQFLIQGVVPDHMECMHCHLYQAVG